MRFPAPVIKFMLRAIVGTISVHNLSRLLLLRLDSRNPLRHQRIAEASGCQIIKRTMRTYSIFLIALVLLLTACGGIPTRHLQAVAAQNGMEESVTTSTRFFHRVFRNNRPASASTLNVYLEGDGLPWVFRYFVVSDPTPRRPLMLHLMNLDDNAAVYIGRPCYNGFSKSENCNKELWTSGRYAPQVVSSMVEVLRREIERFKIKQVNLVGHSGGGALALLIAEQIAETKAVVTMAGNLDTDGWTTLHGYSPLYTSLNPTKRASLGPHIVQVHLMGGRDNNIPPTLARNWVMQQPNAYGVVYEKFDHSCCWASQWQSIVNQLTRGEMPLHFNVTPFKRPEKRYLSHYDLDLTENTVTAYQPW